MDSGLAPRGVPRNDDREGLLLLRREGLGITLGDLGRRGDDQRNDLLHLFAWNQPDLLLGLLGVGQERLVLGERLEGRDERLDPLRRNTRRRDDRARRRLL